MIQLTLKSGNALRKPELIHFFKLMLVYFKKTIKITISIFILGLLFSFSTLWYFSSDLPDYKILANYKPPISSRVHSGEGQLIAEYALQKRLFIPYDYVPKNVIYSFLSAEDKNFFSHPGVDAKSITRATIKNLKNIFSENMFLTFLIVALVMLLASTPGCEKKFLSSADKNE